jgi:hypothetical protein
MYLRKADLLEYKYHGSQKKQSKEELLDLYLACLQFYREAICANTGTMFYMNGC